MPAIKTKTMPRYHITFYHASGRTSYLRTTQPDIDAAMERAREHVLPAIRAKQIKLIRVLPWETAREIGVVI